MKDEYGPGLKTADPHVVSQQRIQVQLREENTVTGLGQAILVIKQGFLTQGLTYLVELTVTHSGTGSLCPWGGSLFQDAV